MMFWYGAHWMFWQSALAWAGMIIFWGIVIWGVYALVSNSRRSADRDRPDRDPRRILDERLARGEIDEAEYKRLRDLLSSSDHRSPADSGAR